MSSDRLGVAHTLEQIADYYELKEDNPFRVRAFRNAARTVLALPGSVEAAVADGSLAKTRGIGPATLAIVKDLLEHGRSEVLEQLQRDIPPGLLEMLELPGLGASRIKLIHEQLGVRTVAELEAAARDGRLAALPRFGEKTAAKILKGIAFSRGAQALQLWRDAAREAEVVRSSIAELAGVTRAVTAGEVRRCCEVVGPLDFAVATDLLPEALRDAIAALPGLTPSPSGPGVSFRSPAGTLVRIHHASPTRFGAALLLATGSASHVTQLQAVAQRRGLSLDTIAAPDEAGCYAALGLAEIPPELREGADEVERAARRQLPRLVAREQLRGLLHCHTTYSDGSMRLEELARLCHTAGYSWLGITDHSRSAAYAGGMSVEQVEQQWAELEAVAAAHPEIRLLKGIESDILVDGALDYDDALLAGFDFVIGSVHGRFSLDESEMTARLLRALDNPYLTILGHPTGRLLLSREPYRFDLEQVFRKAAAHRVALEINGDPHRLDLDWRLVRRAREVGVRFSLGADAHGVSDMVYMEYATAIARKAGLEAHEVLNALDADAFLAFARARRS